MVGVPVAEGVTASGKAGDPIRKTVDTETVLVIPLAHPLWVPSAAKISTLAFSVVAPVQVRPVTPRKAADGVAVQLTKTTTDNWVTRISCVPPPLPPPVSGIAVVVRGVRGLLPVAGGSIGEDRGRVDESVNQPKSRRLDVLAKLSTTTVAPSKTPQGPSVVKKDLPVSSMLPVGAAAAPAAGVGMVVVFGSKCPAQ